MSASAMANLSLAARDDKPKVAVETATLGPSDARTKDTDLLSSIAAYIPTEILTFYVAGIALWLVKDDASQIADFDNAWTTFWAFLAATPIVNFLVYARKVRAANRPLLYQWWKPLWTMIAATIAFVFWAAALPSTPFAEKSWYNPDLAGFLVPVVAAAFGIIGPFFVDPDK